MFATFFQWEVHQEREADFIEIWNEATTILLEQGSLGSALFRGSHGHFHALARWPDQVTRDAAFESVRDHPCFTLLRECIRETSYSDDATEISNLWRFV